VTVTLGADGLSLAAAGQGDAVHWPYATITCLADEVRNGPTRLARGEARLVVDDPGFAPALFAQAPKLKPRGRRALIASGTTAAIVALCAGLLWWSMPRLAGAIASLVPVAWEERMGARILEALHWPRCTAPAGEAALGALTHRLVDGVDVPYRLDVSVRDFPIVNAFALPGGHIVILSGLLKEAQSADEVAGVLAHELTHTLKRHPTRNMIAQEGASLAIAVFTGGGAGGTLGTVLTTLSYTRSAEEEADAGAVEMLQHAGIGLDGFASFFERLSQKEEQGHGRGATFVLPTYLRTHPATQQRAAAIKAQPSQSATPALSDSEWKALKAICDRGGK
jgi:Zn-dependent protease with chaperone function